MHFSGAGGTRGGVGRFFLGLVMMIAGGYLFLNSIHVTHSFGFGTSMLNIGGFSMTGGMVLIPFMFGVGMVFYNARSSLGWGLIAASLIMLFVGVIASIQFRFVHSTAFDLLIILTLFIGGIGLFLSSLRPIEK